MIGTTNTVPHTGHNGTTEWSYQQLREALDRQGSLPPVPPQSLLWQTGNAWPWHDEEQAGPEFAFGSLELCDELLICRLPIDGATYVDEDGDDDLRDDVDRLPPDPTPQPEPGAQWCGELQDVRGGTECDSTEAWCYWDSEGEQYIVPYEEAEKLSPRLPSDTDPHCSSGGRPRWLHRARLLGPPHDWDGTEQQWLDQQYGI